MANITNIHQTEQEYKQDVENRFQAETARIRQEDKDLVLQSGKRLKEKVHGGAKRALAIGTSTVALAGIGGYEATKSPGGETPSPSERTQLSEVVRLDRGGQAGIQGERIYVARDSLTKAQEQAVRSQENNGTPTPSAG